MHIEEGSIFRQDSLLQNTDNEAEDVPIIYIMQIIKSRRSVWNASLLRLLSIAIGGARTSDLESSDLGSSHTRSTSSTVDSEEFNEKHRSPLVKERCNMEPGIVSITSFIQYNHLIVVFLWPPVLIGVISLITTHSKHLRRTPSVRHLISYYKKPDASGRGFRISFPSFIYPKR